MRDGKLLQMAPADEIYNRPADLFVANFTGASNLLAGRVLARNGEFGPVEAGRRGLTASLPGTAKSPGAGNDTGRPENRTGGWAGQRRPHRPFSACVC